MSQSESLKCHVIAVWLLFETYLRFLEPFEAALQGVPDQGCIQEY